MANLFREVKRERTGWRDLDLSKRHRGWGWNCPAVDIDFLFLEYDKGKATALIEYKHESAPSQHASHPTYQALIDLGDRADLPVFVCRYANDFSWWRVTPLNRKAKQYITQPVQFNEREWVSFLYGLRGYNVPEELLGSINIVV